MCGGWPSSSATVVAVAQARGTRPAASGLLMRAFGGPQTCCNLSRLRRVTYSGNTPRRILSGPQARYEAAGCAPVPGPRASPAQPLQMSGKLPRLQPCCDLLCEVFDTGLQGRDAEGCRAGSDVRQSVLVGWRATLQRRAQYQPWYIPERSTSRWCPQARRVRQQNAAA
jgi:hypothetical protein